MGTKLFHHKFEIKKRPSVDPMQHRDREGRVRAELEFQISESCVKWISKHFGKQLWHALKES